MHRNPYTASLLAAAFEIETYAARWQMAHVIMDAQENANESEYSAAERESDGSVSPAAWEAMATRGLELALSDYAKGSPVALWFSAQGFRW